MIEGQIGYMRYAAALAVGLLVSPTTGICQSLPGHHGTVIYFVRHGEVDPTLPTFPLSEAGKLRARTFARTVGSVQFTHVFSSHTTRARQMVEPVAEDLHLPVQQLPRPGEKVDSIVISDRTPSRAAVEPLVETLRALPAGSTALVGVNSDNIYAILHGMGVPAGTAGNPCVKGSTCVPCLTNACFPGGEDQLWILIVNSPAVLPRLIELRYGATP